ncbi:hypothetical protein [Dysosmobacter sp.]
MKRVFAFLALLAFLLTGCREEQLRQLPALLDQRTPAQARGLCGVLGGQLRRDPMAFRKQHVSIDDLGDYLGPYAQALDA